MVPNQSILCFLNCLAFTSQLVFELLDAINQPLHHFVFGIIRLLKFLILTTLFLLVHLNEFCYLLNLFSRIFDKEFVLVLRTC